jgi:hypothetical protein
MLSLLERNIASIHRRFVLVAPPGTGIPGVFRNVSIDEARHASLVANLQRLRGNVYLEDGAVHAGELSSDGRHLTPEDERSWHLVMINRSGDVNACAWYLQHEPTVSMQHLRIRNCPLTADPAWSDLLATAVGEELARARRHDLHYAEVGGWAVSKDSRCTSEGLLLALGAYSLSRLLGGALGYTTATVRHSSSTILRRLGGQSLEADDISVPSYFDPRYGCQMELLRFDSRFPNPKYVGLIELLRGQLAATEVVARPGVVTVNPTRFAPIVAA